jgi:hypothetical protein
MISKLPLSRIREIRHSHFLNPYRLFLLHFQFADFIMISSTKSAPEAEEPITINILIPRYRLRFISVFRSSTIGLLKKFFKDAQLIFNGQMLDDHHTIEFYGIQPNDSIVAIPTAPEEDQTAHWMKITRDADAFEDAVHALSIRTSRREAFRLNDLRALRLESYPRAFRRVCREWPSSGISATAEKTSTKIPLKSSIIQEEPLPVCW